MHQYGENRDILRRQYLLAVLLAAMTLCAWLLLWQMPGHGQGHHGEGHGARHIQGMASLTLMWLVMMPAMMLPVVFPWAMAFSRMTMKKSAGTGHFLAGYFALWTLYSLAGAAAQWILLEKGAIPAGSDAGGTMAGGIVMIITGIYQWSPLKAACLKHCRSPIIFFLTSWRDGRWGAFLMGFRHGLFCLGCCWALMALTFVTGLMSLFWMAAVTILIVIEKMTPAGILASRASGVAMALYGVWLLIAPVMKHS